MPKIRKSGGDGAKLGEGAKLGGGSTLLKNGSEMQSFTYSKR